MYMVFIEADRLSNLHRHRPNLDLDSCGSKHRHGLLIEVSHAAWAKLQRFQDSVAGLQSKLMAAKIEPQFKRSITVGNSRRGQTLCRHVQWDIPPMVDQRSQSQTNLPHNLRPH